MAEDDMPAQNGANERTPLLANGSDAQPVAKPVDDSGVTTSSSASGDVVDATADDLEDADARDGDEEEIVVTKSESTARIAMILGTAYVGIFVGAADASIIATLSAPIASEFHSLSLLSWLAAAYLVANAACQPISGRLTDVVGRGPGLVFSNLFFSAGNLVCAMAQDSTTMLIGRAVAGVGGGGMMSIATFLASDLVPLRKRGVFQGLGNIAYAGGNMLGGVLGGATEMWLTDKSWGGWRLAFYVQVPVSLISALLVHLLVDVPPHQATDDVASGGNNSALSQLSRIDFPGAISLMAFLILFLLGLNAGGNIVPWSHPLVLVSVPLSLVAFGIFVYWEACMAHHPIIPVRLVMRRTVLASCICNLVCTAAMMMSVFYVPLFLQVLGHTAQEAGIRLLFAPLAVSFTSVGSGLIMKATGRYVGLGIVSLLFFVASTILAIFGMNSPESPKWAPFAFFFFMGGSYGAMLTVTLLACVAAVHQSRQAVITSATYAARSVGGTMGLTIASVVFQNILRSSLWGRFGDLPGGPEEIGRIVDDIKELQQLPDGWYPGVIESFMNAFEGVWYTTLALAVIGLVCSLVTKHHTLRSSLNDD